MSITSICLNVHSCFSAPLKGMDADEAPWLETYIILLEFELVGVICSRSLCNVGQV